MKKKKDTVSTTKEMLETIIQGTDPVAIGLLQEIYTALKHKRSDDLDFDEKSWVEEIESTYTGKAANNNAILENLIGQVKELLNNNEWDADTEKFYEILEKIILIKAREDIFKTFFDNMEETITAAIQLDFSKRVPISSLVSKDKQNVLNYAALLLNTLVETMQYSVVSMKTMNTVLSSIPDLITIITDKDHNIRYINTTGEKLLGLEDKELIGKPVNKIIKNFNTIQTKHSKLNNLQKFSTNILLKGFSTPVKATVTKPESLKNWKEIEEIIYTIKIENKKKQNDTFDLTRELHDKMAPLNTILSATNLLSSRYIDKESRELLGMVNSSALNLKQNASMQLMEIIHGDSANGVPVLIDTEHLVKTCIKNISLEDGFDEIKFVSKCTSSGFYCDKQLFESIIQNLLLNTIKYRKKGARNTVQISFEEVDNKDLFLLEVKDKGLGMTKKELDIAFSAESFKNSMNKDNLHFYLVKEAVNKLGGTVEISSSNLKGTTVSVYLPNQVRKNYF